MGWSVKKAKKSLKKLAKVVIPNIYLPTKQVVDLYRLSRRKEPPRDPIYDAGLQDKSFSTADYGAPLTIGYGKFKTNGKVIYGLAEFREATRNREESGTTFVERIYDTDIAWKICKGPVVGVSRIWLNDVLILDLRSGTTGAIGDKVINYVVAADGHIEFQRNLGSGVNIETWRIHLGADSQLPDAMMEANLGAGNVPAHRGWCVISASRLFLNDHNRSVPSLTAEVVVSGQSQDVEYPAINLSNFPPDTGEGLVISARHSILYSAATNYVLFPLATSLSTAGANSEDGTQLQAFGFDDRLEKFNESLYGNPMQEGGTWVLDNVNNVFWRKDSFSLAIASAITGKKMNAWVISGGAINGANSIEFFQARNEIWYTHTVSSVSSINIISAASVLSGASSIVPSMQIAIGLGSSVEMSLVYVHHKQWIVGFADNSSRAYKVYDGSGVLIASGTWGVVSDVFYFATAVVDEANNCLWCIRGQTAARYLVKISLTDFSVTDVKDLTNGTVGNSTPVHLGIDSAAGIVVVYNDTTSSIEFINGSGTVVKSINYSANKTTYGRPVAIAYFPAQAVLIVRAQIQRAIWYRLSRIESSGIAVSEVIESIGDLVGIDQSQFSLSSIASLTLGGLAIEDRGQAKEVLDILQRSLFFDLLQENGYVTAKKRGGAAVMTIDYSELELADDDEQRRPYEFVRADEIDLPSRLDVVYSDIDLDYEDGLQSSSRHAVKSKEAVEETVPVLLTASQAKQIAEVELYSRWAQRSGIRLNGTRKHWKLRGGDVFNFVDELGVQRPLLCTQNEYKSMTSCTIEARVEDTTVYTSTVTGAGSTWTPPTITASTLKRFELLDIPILSDADNYLGFYVAALPGAPTAYLHGSTDNGLTYTNLGVISETPLGYASTTLGNFTRGLVWDDVNSVTVVLYDGSISSVTDDQMLAGNNMFLIGNEFVQAATVTPAGTNTYTLTRLLRGRKGTEWAISTHSSGERFVVLSGARRIASSAKGALAYYKAAPSGADLAAIPATAFTNAQAGHKPLSPVYIQATRDGSNNIIITWLRRSRIGTAWGSVVDIPLDDSLEKYEVDIMQGSTVKRTLTVTAPTATYLVADQTTDFGSAQSSVVVNVYQMSTVVGRGTVGVATV